jgi:ribose transport system ATP-binding protein
MIYVKYCSFSFTNNIAGAWLAGMSTDISSNAVELVGVNKSFGGVPVLKSIDFILKAGAVTAMAGENGAGKSTILKIISGQLRPDSGKVFVSGTEMALFDPKNSRKLGVAIIPQELAPYPDLMVYENIWVGRELKSKFGTLDRREMLNRSKAMLEVFGVDIDVRLPMKKVSVALTQIIEIAKASTWGAKVLLLDEPTSSISDREIERLYDMIKQLKSKGVSMIYTTHRMGEIQKLADNVIVLRDGKIALQKKIEDTNANDIVTAMIGRKLENLFATKSATTKIKKLEVKDLALTKSSPKISFGVHEGEILGFGGLVGAGRTEIIEAVFGVRDSIQGSIVVEGKEIKRGNVKESIKSGLAFVPEDRKGAGLILERSVLDNGSLPNLDSFTIGGFIRPKFREESIKKVMSSVNLKSRGVEQSVGTLSGGNQQKVVLARWLTNKIKVLILDEPTRGVDVGARSEIYSIIYDLAATGIAVVLISSDMPELIGMSNRVLVVRNGEIVGEVQKDRLDKQGAQEEIFRLASGQNTMNQNMVGSR